MHAIRSVRYEHGSCRTMAGVPLWIIAAAIGFVLLIAVIVVAVLLRSATLNKFYKKFYKKIICGSKVVFGRRQCSNFYRRKRYQSEPVRTEALYSVS